MDRKKSSGIVPHPLPSLKPKPEPNRNLRLFFVGLGLGLELVLRFSFRFWPSMYSAGQNHRWLIFLVVPLICYLVLLNSHLPGRFLGYL